MKAGSTRTIEVLMDWQRDNVTKDWSISAWGESGSVSVTSNEGIASDHMPSSGLWEGGEDKKKDDKKDEEKDEKKDDEKEDEKEEDKDKDDDKKDDRTPSPYPDFGDCHDEMDAFANEEHIDNEGF